MNQNVCRRDKFGYCHYGEKCRYKHVEEQCLATNCSVYNCDKRHPKICNFQMAYGRCKFTEYCKYSHKKPKDILENSNKIDMLEKKIENLQETSNSKKNIETNMKIENLEKKIENLIKMSMNNPFEKKVELLENKLKIMEEEFEKKVKEAETSLKLDKADNENETLKCAPPHPHKTSDPP